MVVIQTSNGLFPAEIGRLLEGNAVLVYFWNGQNGTFKTKSAIYPAYLEPPAKLKKVYTYSPNAEQSMQPIWNIIPMAEIAGLTFMTESKGGEQYLPITTQQMVTEFLKPESKKANKTKKT
jgi:hypothetical protein